MGKRILLVDDEPLILKGLKYTLEQDGYETDTAVDGQEALDKFFSGVYDLVLLDVMLPKVDGLSVCQRIRETSSVPIIMLTAKGEDMDKILEAQVFRRAAHAERLAAAVDGVRTVIDRGFQSPQIACGGQHFWLVSSLHGCSSYS